MEHDTRISCSIGVIGDSGVGKSFIVRQFAGENGNAQEKLFGEKSYFDATKVIEFDSKKIHLSITERPYGYCADANIIIYDVTSSNSYFNLTQTVEHVQSLYPKATMLILGNKLDLVERRQVDFDTVKNFADQKGTKHLEISAYNDVSSIEMAFHAVVEDIVNKRGIVFAASGQLLTPRLVELIGNNTTTKWDRLARLLNMEEAFVDDIRCNYALHPDARSKAVKVLEKYKENSKFDVTELVDWLKYLDIKVPDELLSKASKPGEAKSSSQDIKEQVLDNTQLSPREIERLASYIVSSWQRLAGLLNLFEKEVDNVLQSQLYPQPRQKAAKCLNLYNDKHEKFSRNDLAKYLEEIKLLQASKEVLDGTLRKR